MVIAQALGGNKADHPAPSAPAPGFVDSGHAGTLPLHLLYVLLLGLVLSRFGLWLFDLAVSQLQQELVPETELGERLLWGSRAMPHKPTTCADAVLVPARHGAACNFHPKEQPIRAIVCFQVLACSSPRTCAVFIALADCLTRVWCPCLLHDCLSPAHATFLAGAVSGVQASLQSAFEILSFAAGAVVSRPQWFHWLMTGSCGAVVAAAVLYGGYAAQHVWSRQSGQELAMDCHQP